MKTSLKGAMKPKKAKAPPELYSAANATAEFEALLEKTPRREHYNLRLYITGTTPRSTEAIANIRALCNERLGKRYTLEVVDIYQQPMEASDAQIIAAPTLVKRTPKPPRRLIGDLSNRDRIVMALDLPPSAGAKSSRRSTKWMKL